ncbi:MAG TPA: hypothetical protein VF573_27890 [Paraburkholderia sp.]|uniref:hypothetical protein n=1 Tax=Paraburkholderia sp. TaxID=1926495 RepID=UPI002ED6594A
MKIRILTLACATTATALLAACTAVYKNSDVCEQMMRSKLAETSSDTLKIGHTGAGIGGSRVVVEGSIEHVMTASEVAAAAAPLGASAVGVARAVGASGVRGIGGSADSGASAGSAGSSNSVASEASMDSVASSTSMDSTSSIDSAASAVSIDSTVSSSASPEGLSGASAASGVSATSGALSASDSAAPDVRALAVKPAKPKKTHQAAAAECTFHGPTLDVFRWLAPAKLAEPATPADSDADE